MYVCMYVMLWYTSLERLLVTEWYVSLCVCYYGDIHVGSVDRTIRVWKCSQDSSSSRTKIKSQRNLVFVFCLSNLKFGAKNGAVRVGQ